jgi:site-specific recombinase XerD
VAEPLDVGTDWTLVWTDGSPLGIGLDPLLAGFVDLAERELATDIGRNVPILIDPVGRCDIRLSEFFRSPHFSRLSLSTRTSYASDIRMWLEYLASRGKTWSNASSADVDTYWLWRSRRDLNANAVSGSKINRELAAITLLYKWASHRTRAYVPFNPVEREFLTSPRATRTKGTPVRSRNVVAERVKWVTPRTYRLWRSVGIEGYTLNSVRDLSFRGRNSLRNRAMMDLLFSSGLRITEGASLLTPELPASSPHAAGLNEAHLPAAIAKGGHPRVWYLFDDATSLVDSYVRTSRMASIIRAQRTGRYNDAARLMVTDIRIASDTIGLKYSGRWRSHDDIEIADRRCLFIDGENGPEPMWLWLSESGMPLPVAAWSDVMSDGNDRVHGAFQRARGNGHMDAKTRAPRLSPHSLRHSFALYMLIALHHAIDARDGRAPIGGYNEERYRMAWETVRDLLGHRHENTTRERYLAPLNGVRLRSLIGENDMQRALSGLALLDPRVLDIGQTAHG